MSEQTLSQLTTLLNNVATNINQLRESSTTIYPKDFSSYITDSNLTSDHIVNRATIFGIAGSAKEQTPKNISSVKVYDDDSTIVAGSVKATITTTSGDTESVVKPLSDADENFTNSNIIPGVTLQGIHGVATVPPDMPAHSLTIQNNSSYAVTVHHFNTQGRAASTQISAASSKQLAIPRDTEIGVFIKGDNKFNLDGASASPWTIVPPSISESLYWGHAYLNDRTSTTSSLVVLDAEPTYAYIYDVYVKDNSGEPISDASVTFTSGSTIETRTTDSDGFCTFGFNTKYTAYIFTVTHNDYVSTTQSFNSYTNNSHTIHMDANVVVSATRDSDDPTCAYISWLPVPNATEYEIYQDNTLIATVQDTYYKFSSDYGNHKTRVVALAASVEELGQSSNIPVYSYIRFYVSNETSYKSNPILVYDGAGDLHSVAAGTSSPTLTISYAQSKYLYVADNHENPDGTYLTINVTSKVFDITEIADDYYSFVTTTLDVSGDVFKITVTE